jgi:hypothetical protein
MEHKVSRKKNRKGKSKPKDHKKKHLGENDNGKKVIIKNVKVVDPGLIFQLEVENEPSFIFNNVITNPVLTLVWQGNTYTTGHFLSTLITGLSPQVEFKFDDINWAETDPTPCPYTISINIGPSSTGGSSSPIQNPTTNVGKAPYDPSSPDKSQTS